MLTYAGRLFAEQDAAGVVQEYSPLAGMAAVEQRYPAWALGPFSRIELEFAIPAQAGVFALVTDGVVRYVGHARNLEVMFGSRAGIGYVSRRDAQHPRGEERCRLNRLITAEARAGRIVDVYVQAMGRTRWLRRAQSTVSPLTVAAEIVATNRGDWHLPE